MTAADAVLDLAEVLEALPRPARQAVIGHESFGPPKARRFLDAVSALAAAVGDPAGSITDAADELVAAGRAMAPEARQSLVTLAFDAERTSSDLDPYFFALAAFVAAFDREEQP